MGGRGASFGGGGGERLNRLSTEKLITVANTGWLPSGKGASEQQLKQVDKILQKRLGKDSGEIALF